jgi:hydrogenase-4 component E
MPSVEFVSALNGLAGGLFLLSLFGLVSLRQVQSCLRIFASQSALLATSALLLADVTASVHLVVVGLLTIGSKVVLIPWLLRRTVHWQIYTRRELSQTVNTPASLLIALLLAALAVAFTAVLLPGRDAFVRVNLPIGMAGLLLGAYTVTVRREAVPQLIGLLAMENSVFFAGVSIAPDLPLIAELGAAFDVLVIALVMGLLVRAIHEHMGTTDVQALAALREERLL